MYKCTHKLRKLDEDCWVITTLYTHKLVIKMHNIIAVKIKVYSTQVYLHLQFVCYLLAVDSNRVEVFSVCLMMSFTFHMESQEIVDSEQFCFFFITTLLLGCVTYCTCRICTSLLFFVNLCRSTHGWRPPFLSFRCVSLWPLLHKPSWGS